MFGFVLFGLIECWSFVGGGLSLNNSVVLYCDFSCFVVYLLYVACLVFVGLVFVCV